MDELSEGTEVELLRGVFVFSVVDFELLRANHVRELPEDLSWG